MFIEVTKFFFIYRYQIHVLACMEEMYNGDGNPEKKIDKFIKSKYNKFY